MTRRHEDRVLVLALAAAAIPTVVALPMIWLAGFDLKTQVTLTLAIAVGVVGFALAARGSVLRPLQTIGNLIASLRERDYSVRGRHSRRDDSLGAVIAELTCLADEMRAERWRDEETAAGLARVVERLDVAVFAFDRDGIVRLANRTAARLVARDPVGVAAAEIGLAEAAALDAPATLQLAFAGGAGVWEVRPSEVRLSGMPHRLVVMTDVQHALRAEERQAWKRLVRVLGHEINNSLGPIASIAETLRSGLAKPQRSSDFDDDLARGLDVIERRAAALSRFMQAYTRLVRLPPPRIGRVEVAAWIDRTVALETRARVEIAGGPAVVIPGDADQLDQMLINLLRNAVDASLETTGGVRIAWRAAGDTVTVVIEDDGPGVADATSLFVPFFTTKPGGSGIGLVLARQIAEAHHGTLAVRNRSSGRGAEAVIALPAAVATVRAAS